MNEPKPGWKTTEFWVTIVTKILAILLAAFGVSTGHEITEAASLFGSAIAIGWGDSSYSKARAKTKTGN